MLRRKTVSGHALFTIEAFLALHIVSSSGTPSAGSTGDDDYQPVEGDAAEDYEEVPVTTTEFQASQFLPPAPSASKGAPTPAPQEDDVYDDYDDEAKAAEAAQATAPPATPNPTAPPTNTPTRPRTKEPTLAPTPTPTPLPTSSDSPTRAPTMQTQRPTLSPTLAPPTRAPTLAPTPPPTKAPSFDGPTLAPTPFPTLAKYNFGSSSSTEDDNIASDAAVSASAASVPGESLWTPSPDKTKTTTEPPSFFKHALTTQTQPPQQVIIQSTLPPTVSLLPVTQAPSAILPGAYVTTNLPNPMAVGNSMLPAVQGNCDASCKSGCEACSSLCRGCPACDPKLPGPFGTAQWCTPNITASENPSSQMLQWTPASENPLVQSQLGQVSFNMQGSCKLLCYEVWASPTIDFQHYEPYTISGTVHWPVSEAGDEMQFFKVRSIEMANSELEVTRSGWSNTVHRQKLLSTTVAALGSSTKSDSTVTTTTTTSPTYRTTTTTYPYPVVYVPMWKAQSASSPVSDGQPDLKADLDFVVLLSEIQDYCSPDVVAETGNSIAAMLSIDPSKVHMDTVSAAHQIMSQQGRRLAASSTVRAGYHVICDSDDQYMNLSDSLSSLASDQEARDRFSDTLASKFTGRLTPVDPDSLISSGVTAWHPPSTTLAGFKTHTLPRTTERGWQKSWVLFSLALLALLVGALLFALYCLPQWAVSRKIQKVIEKGSAPLGSRGFKPGHKAELKEAAVEAQFGAWGYDRVPNADGFYGEHKLAPDGAHYGFGFSHWSQGVAHPVAPDAHGPPAHAHGIQTMPAPHAHANGQISPLAHGHGIQTMPAPHAAANGQAHGVQSMPPLHAHGAQSMPPSHPASQSSVHPSSQSSAHGVQSMPPLHAHGAQSMPPSHPASQSSVHPSSHSSVHPSSQNSAHSQRPQAQVVQSMPPMHGGHPSQQGSVHSVIPQPSHGGHPSQQGSVHSVIPQPPQAPHVHSLPPQLVRATSHTSQVSQSSHGSRASFHTQLTAQHAPLLPKSVR